MIEMATKKRVGRPKGTEPALVTMPSFRGSSAFREWFGGFVVHVRRTSGWSSIAAGDVIERSLHCMAKEIGYKPPPPRR